jgi:hypothetical protein
VSQALGQTLRKRIWWAVALALALGSLLLIVGHGPQEVAEERSEEALPQPSSPAQETVARVADGRAPASREAAAPGTKASLKRWLVRDALSGNTLPALRLFARGGGASENSEEPRQDRNPRVVDDSGMIDIEGLRPEALYGDDLEIVEISADDAEAVGTIWVCRTSVVSGVIRAEEDGLSLAQVSLFLHSGLDGVRESGTDPAIRLTERAWHRFPALRNWPRRVGGPKEDGTFSLRVPRFPGLILVADAPGWCSAIATLRGEEREEGVALTLKRGLTVTGVVRDEFGKPLTGVKVVVYVTRQGAYDDLDPRTLRANQSTGGISAWRSRLTNKSLVSMSASGKTDATGTFRIPARSVGDVRVRAFGRGRRLVDLAVPRASRDVNVGDLVAPAAAESDSVRVEFRGNPVCSWPLMLADLSVVEQVTFGISTDDSGRLATSWLLPGHVYQLIPEGPLADGTSIKQRFFRWEAGERLELSSMAETWSVEDGIAK